MTPSGSREDPIFLKVKNLDDEVIELRSKLSDLIGTSWSTEKVMMKFIGEKRRRSTRRAFYERVSSRLNHRGDAS